MNFKSFWYGTGMWNYKTGKSYFIFLCSCFVFLMEKSARTIQFLPVSYLMSKSQLVALCPFSKSFPSTRDFGSSLLPFPYFPGNGRNFQIFSLNVSVKSFWVWFFFFLVSLGFLCQLLTGFLCTWCPQPIRNSIRWIGLLW